MIGGFEKTTHIVVLEIWQVSSEIKIQVTKKVVPSLAHKLLTFMLGIVPKKK